MRWQVGHPIPQAVLVVPEPWFDLDDHAIASGQALLAPPPLSPCQKDIVRALVEDPSPAYAKLAWANVQLPGVVFGALCQHMVASDKSGLVQSLRQMGSLPSKVVRETMSALAGAKAGGVADALGRMQGLHAVVDAGARIEDPLDEDRHCLPVIAALWLDPGTPSPFASPGALGAVACLANLVCAYRADVHTPMSDPTGHSRASGELLLQDEKLRPYLMFERGQFQKGLLDTATCTATPLPRPRL